MARTLEKKSKKPEIEILPVREGVQAVDDWYPVYGLTKKGDTAIVRWDIPEEFQIVKSMDKNIIIQFDKIFDTSDKLNTFYLRYKGSYISKIFLITHYINYFIHFYDEDNELITNYFYIKYFIDLRPEIKDMKRTEFIELLYSQLITDSIYEKVKKMVEDNYRVDLASTNVDNIKYSESLEFTNEHAKMLFVVSIIIKILIPVILHYITLYRDKNEIHELYQYYKPIFDMIEEKEHINLYGKMYNSINVKVSLSENKNKVIWDKYEVEGEDTTTYTEELLDKNIIVDNIFKYLFVKNIIAFNSVIIDTQLDFFVIKNLNINMREISTDKDSEGLSSLDKLEMNTIKIDESLIVLSKINIKKTIKHIKKLMNIEITKEERDFYKKYMLITPIGKSLIFYYYAKYFDGYRDLNSITLKQYIDLMILMKRSLQMRGDIYLPQIISAQICGRINSRTIHNAKLLDKIQSSEMYKQLLSKKYKTLSKMEKSDVIISTLSTLINTQFLYCDYDLEDMLGQEIEIDFDVLCQEYMSFVAQV